MTDLEQLLRELQKMSDDELRKQAAMHSPGTMIYNEAAKILFEREANRNALVEQTRFIQAAKRKPVTRVWLALTIAGALLVMAFLVWLLPRQ